MGGDVTWETKGGARWGLGSHGRGSDPHEVSAVLWWGWGLGYRDAPRPGPGWVMGYVGGWLRPVFSFIIPPLRMKYTFPHSLSKVFQKSYVTPVLAFSVAN